MYLFSCEREVVRIETLSLEINAKSKEEAERIAIAFASGEDFKWPDVNRYVITEVEPIEHRLLKVTDAKS